MNIEHLSVGCRHCLHSMTVWANRWWHYYVVREVCESISMEKLSGTNSNDWSSNFLSLHFATLRTLFSRFDVFVGVHKVSIELVTLRLYECIYEYGIASTFWFLAVATVTGNLCVGHKILRFILFMLGRQKTGRKIRTASTLAVIWRVARVLSRFAVTMHATHSSSAASFPSSLTPFLALCYR